MSKFFYPLVENPYRKKDIKEGIKVLKSGKLTIGSKTETFQKIFSKKMKTKNSRKRDRTEKKSWNIKYVFAPWSFSLQRGNRGITWVWTVERTP